MRKRKHWLSVLDKREMAHLKENFTKFRYSKWAIQQTLKYQRDNKMECWDCKQIAKKLNITLDANYK